jgi:hypothetical protein
MAASAGFFAWMDAHGLALEAIGPVHVAAWVEGLVRTHETASVKQQLRACACCSTIGSPAACSSPTQRLYFSVAIPALSRPRRI